MFTWFLTQLQSKALTLFLGFCLLANVILLMVALLRFIFIYKNDKFFVNKFIPYYKKLSPIRKLILGNFTLFYAVPIKFWVAKKLILSLFL